MQGAINSHLDPNGRTWEAVDTMPIDPSLATKSTAKSQIKWPDSNFNIESSSGSRGTGHHEPLDYFLHFFPMAAVPDILTATNQVLGTLGFRSLGKAELFKWLGIQLSMAAEPLRGGNDVYWKSGENEKTCYRFGDYQRRFYMSQGRYQQIREALRFTPAKENSFVNEVFTVITVLSEFQLNKCFFQGPSAGYPSNI